MESLANAQQPGVKEGIATSHDASVERDLSKLASFPWPQQALVVKTGLIGLSLNRTYILAAGSHFTTQNEESEAFEGSGKRFSSVIVVWRIYPLTINDPWYIKRFLGNLKCQDT